MNPRTEAAAAPAVKHDRFDYDTTFPRNLGWVTAEDQARLNATRVAMSSGIYRDGPSYDTSVRVYG
jgi:hypothetical protein